MASPRGVGHSPFTKAQMAKISTLVKDLLTKAVKGRKLSMTKRDIVETVKNQVVRELGSLTKSVRLAVVENTVLNKIEEVWTDLDKIWVGGRRNSA